MRSSRLFNVPTIRIGGRYPVQAGAHPHLAEIVPEIAIPRHYIVGQIENLMQSQRLVVVLSLPGVGKSVLARNLRFKHAIPWDNFFTSDIRSTNPCTLDQLSNNQLDKMSPTLFLDDIHPFEQIERNLARLLDRGKNVVLFHPAAYENNYIDLAQGDLSKSSATIVLYPPANYDEFAQVHSRVARYLTDDAIKGIYNLCGGNMRFARFVIFGPEDGSAIQAKIRAGIKLNPEEIDAMIAEIELRFAHPLHSLLFLNFKAHLILLDKYFKGKQLLVSQFWKLPFTEKEIVIKLLKYGLLTLTSDQKAITFKGTLIRRRFELGPDYRPT